MQPLPRNWYGSKPTQRERTSKWSCRSTNQSSDLLPKKLRQRPNATKTWQLQKGILTNPKIDRRQQKNCKTRRNKQEKQQRIDGKRQSIEQSKTIDWSKAIRIDWLKVKIGSPARSTRSIAEIKGGEKQSSPRSNRAAQIKNKISCDTDSRRASDWKGIRSPGGPEEAREKNKKDRKRKAL